MSAGVATQSQLAITYLHPLFADPQIKVEDRAHMLARGLASAGHRVTTIAAYPKFDLNEEDGWAMDTGYGMRGYWIKVPNADPAGFAMSGRDTVRFYRQVVAHASKLPTDVVLAAGTSPTVAYPAVQIARRLDVPLVWEEVGTSLETLRADGLIPSALLPAIKRHAHRKALRNAEYVVTPTLGVQTRIVEAGYPQERTHVIPDGCDAELFAATPAEAQAYRSWFEWLGNRPLILWVARGAESGVQWLTNIAAEMMDIAPDVRFLLVANGFRAQTALALANAAGIADKNMFIEHETAFLLFRRAYAAATACFAPASDGISGEAGTADGFYSALAAGKPVITNAEGWQADLLRKSGAGIVLPFDDAREAARRIHAALMDQTFLAHASQAASTLARTRLDIAPSVARLSQVLHMAVQSYRQR